jgi:hypothetical protein
VRPIISSLVLFGILISLLIGSPGTAGGLHWRLSIAIAGNSFEVRLGLGNSAAAEFMGDPMRVYMSDAIGSGSIFLAPSIAGGRQLSSRAILQRADSHA